MNPTRSYSLIYALFFSWVCLVFSHSTIALSLSASVDRTSLSIDETLLLTVTLDRQGADALDTSALALEFDILQRQQSSKTSIINGRISAKTQWTFVLAPKTEGELLIPSLSSMGAFSDPISIRVNTSGSKSSQGATGQTRPDVFLEASVDKHQVYVQEQVLLRLRLYYRVSLSGYTPEELTLNNSTAELSHRSNYQKSLGGVPYNVLELSYVLHPQASGQLVIPAQTWQIEKSLNRFGTIRSPYLRVKSQEQTIEVKPIASSSTAETWLPASQVELSQQWLQSTITAKVGEPLTYSLNLSAKGLSHSQLPAISLQSTDNFTIYDDQANTNNELSDKGVVGSRISNYAIIPKSPGTFELPAVELKWWNVNSDKEETIRLAPQKIIVASSEIASEQTPSIPSTPAISPGLDTNSSLLNHWLWSVASLGFALLALVFFILWQRQSPREIIHTSEAIDDQQETLSSHNTIKDIEAAIAAGQWQQLQALIHRWASIQTSQTLSSNQAVIAYFPDLAVALEALDKQLYSPSHTMVWDFKELVGILKQQKLEKKKTSNQKLQPLYPQH